LATSARAGEPARAEAQDVLQWGLQAAGVTFPVADVHAEVHQAPDGPIGIFDLPLTDVVDLARRHLTRGFNAAECATYHLQPCPSATAGLASPATTGPADLPTGSPPGQPGVSDRPLAGTTITILDPLGEQPLAQGAVDAEQAELQQFQAATGIAVDVLRPGAPLAITALPNGKRPDIVIWPYPGTLNDLARDGRLVDLSTYLDRSSLRQQLGDYFVDTATIGSGVYWIPINFYQKALVWYPIRQFQQAGYQVPHTWDELIALSQQMVADGRYPWCFGLEGGPPYTGSDATDWLEALVLRVGGADTYDRWTTHGVPFDNAVVRRAGQMFGQMAFSDHYVLGGTVGTKPTTSRVSFPLFDQPPGCWMFLGSDSEASFLPPRARLGEDIDYFALPPLDAGTTPNAIGGAVAAAAMTDRPEVREFMRYLAGSSWGAVGATLHLGAAIPARVNLSVTDCVDRSGTVEANAVRIRLCQEARTALATAQWRFDASDLMPGAVGVIDADGNSGAFVKGMVRYINEGPDSLDKVLAEIDASWAAVTSPRRLIS
jgi:alpha-glucoside transport system substrate-binding protein